MKRVTPYEQRKIPRYTGPCAACGETFTGHYARRMCDPCRPGAYRLCQQANAKIQQAVKRGLLPDLRKVSVPCVGGCGRPASLWKGVPDTTLPSIARVLASKKPLPAD